MPTINFYQFVSGVVFWGNSPTEATRFRVSLRYLGWSMSDKIITQKLFYSIFSSSLGLSVVLSQNKRDPTKLILFLGISSVGQRIITRRGNIILNILHFMSFFLSSGWHPSTEVLWWSLRRLHASFQGAAAANNYTEERTVEPAVVPPKLGNTANRTEPNQTE